MGGCTRTCFVASFFSFSYFLCSNRSSIRGGMLNNEMGRKGKRSQRFERVLMSTTPSKLYRIALYRVALYPLRLVRNGWTEIKASYRTNHTPKMGLIYSYF